LFSVVLSSLKTSNSDVLHSLGTEHDIIPPPKKACEKGIPVTQCFVVLQTPVWDETEIDESLGTRHKRSNSWGSADQKIKEVSITHSGL